MSLALEDIVKRYIITTAQYNAVVHNNLKRNMDLYSEKNNGEIIVLPTTGKNITDDPILHKKLQLYRVIDSDYSINKSIKIKDFGARPQQINPLTGLERFCQGDKSYIMPGTKQVFKFVSNSYDDIPKAIMTTGAITRPNYNLRHRTGRIASQDHEYGFVVVEVENNKYFHFRHVTALRNGNFSDITGVYKNGKHYKNTNVNSIVLGDIHPGEGNPKHKKASMEQIDLFKPKSLFLHDVFNGRSISHHYKGHNIEKHKVYEEQGLLLEKELKDTLKEIQSYSKSMGHGIVYIVASNHDEHLYRYLDEGRFVNDKGNDLIGSQLYTAALQGHNPLEYGLDLVGTVPENVIFIARDTGHKVLGYELGNHGDLGSNGGRGSPRSTEAANSKSITAHSHSAFKLRNTHRVGTSTKLRLSYNRGYSNWSNSNGVLYDMGTVQHLHTINSKWRKK